MRAWEIITEDQIRRPGISLRQLDQLEHVSIARVASKARRHSRKPEDFYEMVETLCPGSKVELFARSRRKGWTNHGDEVGWRLAV